MLADDLGGARVSGSKIRCRRLFDAFERVARDANIRSWSPEEGEGRCRLPAACIPAGLSSQGASRGLIEDVRVASHMRSRGIGEQLVQWAVAEARGRGCKLVRTADASTRASMRNGFMSGSASRAAMSA
jgi:GNAT superfamily N-acetyltransferase